MVKTADTNTLQYGGNLRKKNSKKLYFMQKERIS